MPAAMLPRLTINSDTTCIPPNSNTHAPSCFGLFLALIAVSTAPVLHAPFRTTHKS